MGTLMDLSFWRFFGLGLLALVLLLLGMASLWQSGRDAQSRLPLTSGMPAPAEPPSRWHWLSTSPRVERWLEHLPRIRDYDRFVQQTGWPLTVAQVLVATLTLGSAISLAALLLGLAPVLVLACGLLAMALPQAVLVWKRGRHTRLLELQLPDALDLIARSMQAGHAFTSALQLAGRESPHPMGTELGGVVSAIQYGASVQDALVQWASRVAGDDVRIFVTSVRIQTETGGNLAELMQHTASLIRERQKLRGTIRVLSAEGRISAWILTLLPFVLAVLMTALNPQFMGRLWHDPQGQRLVAAALLLMLAGMLWMWRLVQIRP